MVGGNGQSIEPTDSDVIVCSWPRSTVAGSSKFGYFSSIIASSWLFTPRTVVVDSPLVASWQLKALLLDGAPTGFRPGNHEINLKYGIEIEIYHRL